MLCKPELIWCNKLTGESFITLHAVDPLQTARKFTHLVHTVYAHSSDLFFPLNYEQCNMDFHTMEHEQSAKETDHNINRLSF